MTHEPEETMSDTTVTNCVCEDAAPFLYVDTVDGCEFWVCDICGHMITLRLDRFGIFDDGTPRPNPDGVL